jgi:hypothetical protein
MIMHLPQATSFHIFLILLNFLMVYTTVQYKAVMTLEMIQQHGY